jgi:L-amino acid N-acyltransferase YncA
VLETNQAKLKEWAEKHNMPTPSDARYLGTSFNGVIKGVVVYCGFYGKSCNVHITGDGSHWATRDFLKWVFALPFKKWNLKVIIGTVAGSNKKALKLDRHLGFREVATIADAHNDGDLVILEMRPADCRYLGD